MYLNANQKKGLIYLSTAGALLLAHKQKHFNINNKLLLYYLKEIDNIMLNIASTNVIDNLIQTYFCLDWCKNNAFATNKNIKTKINKCLGVLKSTLKQFKKQDLIESLIKFVEVEL